LRTTHRASPRTTWRASRNLLAQVSYLSSHDTTGCSTGLTGWMFVYTMQPVVQPRLSNRTSDWTTGWTTGRTVECLYTRYSCCSTGCLTGCSTGLTSTCIRCRRKKFTFGISSPDEFLFIYVMCLHVFSIFYFPNGLYFKKRRHTSKQIYWKFQIYIELLTIRL